MVGKSWTCCLQKEVPTGSAVRPNTVIQKVSTEGQSCARPGDTRQQSIHLLAHSFIQQLATEFKASAQRAGLALSTGLLLEALAHGMQPKGKTQECVCVCHSVPLTLPA